MHRRSVDTEDGLPGMCPHERPSTLGAIAPRIRSGAWSHVEARLVWETWHGGALSGGAVDGGKSGRLTSRVGDLLLMKHADAEHDDAKHNHQEKRKYEGCFDQRLPARTIRRPGH